MTVQDHLLDELRPTAFGIAYRMLGSVSEAEDVVQETLLRVHQALEGGASIASPRAYVTTIATRLAINELRSARVRRERYIGEWLPEPMITGGNDDPLAHAETADALSVAMLALLERLTPEQRAALLLHDVFDYGYEDISAILGKREAAVRQLASRARRHVRDHRPRFSTTPEHYEDLSRRFFTAVETGDLAGLEALLVEDVTLTGDGGGKVGTFPRPLQGRRQVARTLVKGLRLALRIPGVALRQVEINGGPGAVLLDPDERLIGVLTIDVGEGRIVGIGSIVNPDKLDHLGPVADANALLRSLA